MNDGRLGADCFLSASRDAANGFIHRDVIREGLPGSGWPQQGTAAARAIFEIKLGARTPFERMSLSESLTGRPSASVRVGCRLGERAGARTQDPVIKSHVLYRLSYGLGPRVCTGGLVRGQ